MPERGFIARLRCPAASVTALAYDWACLQQAVRAARGVGWPETGEAASALHGISTRSPPR